jgi:hypothetical protein
VQSAAGLSTNRFDKEIAFSSVMEEAGFILVAHAVDFGSGFRPVLHEHRGGAGAWVTIRAGLVNLGLANKACEATWLAGLTLADVQGFFDLNVNELRPLAVFLQEDLNELGTELLKRGFSTPGEFVEAVVDQGATGMVAQLVETFPLTFNDQYEVGGQRVCFFKKAQLVVSELFMRFNEENERFNFTDVNNLTAFVDNVVVAMMRLNGCIDVNDSALSARLDAGECIEKGSEEEVALRARAVTATELIVEWVNDFVVSIGPPVLNAQRLCNWLWGGLGKHPANRKYPRHLTPSTSFY